MRIYVKILSFNKENLQIDSDSCSHIPVVYYRLSYNLDTSEIWEFKKFCLGKKIFLLPGKRRIAACIYAINIFYGIGSIKFFTFSSIKD